MPGPQRRFQWHYARRIGGASNEVGSPEMDSFYSFVKASSKFKIARHVAVHAASSAGSSDVRGFEAPIATNFFASPGSAKNLSRVFSKLESKIRVSSGSGIRASARKKAR